MSASVSVIIPTWNRSSTILAAVNSALAQTVAPLEVLVCDDGSTDHTEALIASLGDQRVRWLPGVHSGRPASPRNRGIRVARGQWIAFLDSDDQWMPEKLQHQLALASTENVQAVCTGAIQYLPGHGTNGLLHQQPVPDTFGLTELLRGNLLICSSVLVHRNVLQMAMDTKGEFFPEIATLTVGEDYALWMRIACLSRFAMCRKALVLYCDDAPNSVRKDQPHAWHTYYYATKNVLEWCTGKAGNPFAENALPHIRLRYQKMALLHRLAPLIKFMRKGRVTRAS